MAAIGHRQAVVDAFGVKLGGIPAVVLWGLVHVAYLVGWGNRLGTVGRWLWALAARDRRELSISETAQITAGHAFSEDGAASSPARAGTR
jgi:NADH dehydrogenase